jgi:hypothetical protein
MSHTLSQLSSLTVFATVTIIDYPAGGEPVSVVGLNYNNFLGVCLGQVPPSQNSLNVPLFSVLDGGKIRLFRFVSGAPQEIPATSGLNAVVPTVLGFG